MNIQSPSLLPSMIVSQQSEGALIGATHSKVTASATHLPSQSGKVTEPKETSQPQLNQQATTRSKPWTPPKPALPLTAALTAMSYSLSESEFSADGDEAEPRSEGPETLNIVPALTLTTPSKTVYSRPVLQRTTPIQPGDRTGTTAIKHVTTCADRPCFPGVVCEPAIDGGFRCGRCPVGYTGDGRACRGKAPCLQYLLNDIKKLNANCTHAETLTKSLSAF